MAGFSGSQIVRMGASGHARQINGSFAGKEAAVVEETAIVTSSGTWNKDWSINYGPDRAAKEAFDRLPRSKKARRRKLQAEKRADKPAVVATQEISVDEYIKDVSATVLARREAIRKKKRQRKAMAILLLTM